MKALILADAAGSAPNRLAAGPMLRICGIPLLEIQVELLRQQGVTEILFAVGTSDTAVEDHFGDGSRFGLRTATIRTCGPALTLAAAGQILRFFDDSVLIVQGDALIEADYKQLITAHHQARAQALAQVTVVRQIPAIEQIGERAAFGSAMQSSTIVTDLLVVQTETLSLLPAHTPLDSASNLLRRLVEHGLHVHAAVLPLTWLRSDNTSAYLHLHWQALNDRLPGFERARRASFNAAGLSSGINVQINRLHCHVEGRVHVSGSARIADSVSLMGPCYVGPGAVIEGDAIIERSVVLPHVRVSGHTHLRDAVTDGRYCLLADGSEIDLARSDLGWLIDDARRLPGQRAASEQRFLDHLVA